METSAKPQRRGVRVNAIDIIRDDRLGDRADDGREANFRTGGKADRRVKRINLKVIDGRSGQGCDAQDTTYDDFSIVHAAAPVEVPASVITNASAQRLASARTRPI